LPVERLLALVVLTAVAVGVALVLQRRRPDPPSAPSYRAPVQLDRDEFTGPADHVLVVVFGSTTCDTCPKAWATVGGVLDALEPAVPVSRQRIDVQHDPHLHHRYRIDGVPTTLVVDTEGVVVQAFFGPLTADDLRQALGTAGVASARPGPEPSPGD
jgi:hypothetical protein